MDKNPFQRAQDFLRNKLNPAFNPATATSQQQTDIDARNAKKAIEDLQRAKNVKQLRQLGQAGGQLFGLGRQLITGGSQMLVGDGSQFLPLAAMTTSDAINTFKSKDKAIQDPPISGQNNTKENVQITLKDGKELSFDLSTEDGADAMNRAIDAQQSLNPPIDDSDPLPVVTAPPVYNAKERVKKHGVKKAEDMAMMEWAKAHKDLAEKVKPGQAGYDAIQLALGKTTVEPEDIRGFMDDSGKSAEEARTILGGGFVETVIDGDKPMVTTINQAPSKGGPEVEIPAGNFSEMSQSMQDLVAPSLEAGAAFNINVDNVMNQNDPQAFLKAQLKKIQGSMR